MLSRSKCTIASRVSTVKARPHRFVWSAGAALAGSGVRVTVLWHRPGFSTFMNRAKHLPRKVAPAAMPTREQSQSRARAFRRSWVRRAWVILALLDTFAHYCIVLRVAARRADFVICDRFLGDANLDFEINSRSRSASTLRSCEPWSGVDPTDKAFLLMLPEDVP